MTHPFANVAYADIRLSYDRELFTKEYDDVIFPASKPFISITDQWRNMQRLNHIWHVLPKDVFEDYDRQLAQGASSLGGNSHQWDMVNLMQAVGDEPVGGGAWWRHRNLDVPKIIKPEFEGLEIVRWIKEHIPAQQLIGIHCVSIEPNGFSAVHRDGYWQGDAPNPARRNGFYNLGHVVISLNISNGGVPLQWCLDGDETRPPRTADTDTFMISDYFHHAVPLTTTRRRQIRISFKPTPALHDLIDWSTAVTVPEDFAYTW